MPCSCWLGLLPSVQALFSLSLSRSPPLHPHLSLAPSCGNWSRLLRLWWANAPSFGPSRQTIICLSMSFFALSFCPPFLIFPCVLELEEAAQSELQWATISDAQASVSSSDLLSFPIIPSLTGWRAVCARLRPCFVGDWRHCCCPPPEPGSHSTPCYCPHLHLQTHAAYSICFG